MPSLIHRLFTSDEVETRSETASLCVETAQTESAVGVIQAEELHSAAPTLVELFHEEAPAQEAETASTEHVDPNEDEPARDYDPVTGGSAAVAVASEAALTPNDDTTSDDEARVESAASAADGFHDEPHVAIPSPPSTAESHRAPYRDWAFEDKLASHHEWVESHGLTGKRADLSGAELEAMDLISVNLRLADLHDANLKAADLLLADLRDACLVRADLEESCLVGANLEGANLEGASLETAMGLVPRQIAGANLRDAQLAPQLMEFHAEAQFTRNSRRAYRYFKAMTGASFLSWLIIWRTRDAQLVADSSVIPFLHSRAAAAALPTAETYLIAPVVLFILYLLFHFHVQGLWDSVQELPAIFPDGRTLGESEPWIVVGLLRTHFRWMNPDPTSTRLVERGGSQLLVYGIVPVTLLLFWVRYLTRQEIHGTMLQAGLVMVAGGIAVYAATKTGRPQERWRSSVNGRGGWLRRSRRSIPSQSLWFAERC